MILVTGGAGFIGSHLAEALLKGGHKVRILDNLSTGKKENLEEISGERIGLFPGEDKPQRIPLGRNLEFDFGDITSLEVCRRSCSGAEAVLHQAALGSVQRSVEDPIRTHEANATGTLNILQAAKEAKVQRLVYASSSSVYGNIGGGPSHQSPRRKASPPRRNRPTPPPNFWARFTCGFSPSAMAWKPSPCAISMFSDPARTRIRSIRPSSPGSLPPCVWRNPRSFSGMGTSRGISHMWTTSSRPISWPLKSPAYPAGCSILPAGSRLP